MALSARPFDTLTEADLGALIKNSVAESIRLDFKREPVGTNDAAKREFLKDVCAFANSQGGDLVFGVAERDGTAESLVPITDRSQDEEIRRLESLISDGIEPRLTGVRIGPVPAAAGGYFLVVRVPASWNRPHRVRLGRTNRFYRRRDRSAYEMDVDELRAAFGEWGETERRLLAFRDERLRTIRQGRPVRLHPRGQLVVHVVPLRPVAGAVDIERAYQNPDVFSLPGGLGRSRYVNFDGLLLTDTSSGPESQKAFVQLFRDGRLEVARGEMVGQNPFNPQQRSLVTRHLREVMQAVLRYLDALVSAGVEPPFAMLISVLEVEGTFLPSGAADEGSTLCDRPDLLLPPALVENPSDHAETLKRLRYPLDVLWNAFGLLRCPLISENGEWQERRA
jgi:hypothetical protein